MAANIPAGPGARRGPRHRGNSNRAIWPETGDEMNNDDQEPARTFDGQVYRVELPSVVPIENINDPDVGRWIWVRTHAGTAEMILVGPATNRVYVGAAISFATRDYPFPEGENIRHSRLKIDGVETANVEIGD